MDAMDKILKKKKWYQKKSVWFTIVGIGALVTLYVIFLSDTSSKLNVDLEKITVEEVKKDYFLDYMAEVGTVEPIRTVYLDAMEGGRVEEIVIEEGSMLNKGDVILILSNPMLHLQILNSEANLAEQENFLRNTRVQMEANKLELKRQIVQLKYNIKQQQRDFEKNKLLFEKELISEEEYLVSKENYEYSIESMELLSERRIQDSIYRKLQVDQMEDALYKMRENLLLVRRREDNLRVKAPITGQLGQLDAEIGEQKVQGQRLGFINDLSAYKVMADVDEHYLARVTNGLNAEGDFSGITYQMRIKKVYPQVNNGQFRVDLIFKSNFPDNIRTGQTSRMKIELGESKEALLVPRGGFYQSTGGQWVYLVDRSSNEAIKRDIKIGRQNPTYYEVLEGLEPGEEVITSSYDNFGDVDKLILR
jgi:HlyD family secretion protein